MAPPSLLARPLAALAAGLLVVGLVQAAPAAADEPVMSPGLALTVSAVGLTGGTEAQPADLGVAPGSAALVVVVTNLGPDAVSGLTVDGALVSNGVVTAPACDTTELAVGQSATCTATVGEVASGSSHESTFTANGSVGDPATAVSAEASFFGTASEPAPAPLAAAAVTISAPASAVVGSSVTVSGALTRDEVPYAASTVLERQVDGSGSWTPVTDVASGADGVLSKAVTPDRSALYRFTFAGDSTTSAATSPTARVTVVPKQSVALTVSAPGSATAGSTITVRGTVRRAGQALATTTQLQRQVDGGAWATVTDVRSSSSGALSATVKADRTAGYRYHYAGTGTVAAGTSPVVRVTVVPKQAVTLTASAPARAITGTTFTVKGSIKRVGKAFGTKTQLQRQVGDGPWTTVRDVTSTSKGALSVTVKADRTAGYRYRYAGTSTIAAGTSNVERVTVAKATVRLAVSAPASVTKGKSITVRGSIKRAGKGYRTTTLLQFSSGSGWGTVKKVKSSSKGTLSTSIKPSRTGEYRFRFTGNSTTASGQSGGDRVTVKPKPPAKPKPRAYANCAALNKVYPHGVGRSGARDKVRGSTAPVTDFVRDTATYNKNTKSDRDKDGVACEKQ